MVIVVEIPKSWMKIGKHCYLDEKGIPHIITKTNYKSNEKKRKRSLDHARKNKESARKRTAAWREKNNEKKKNQSNEYANLNKECINLSHAVNYNLDPTPVDKSTKKLRDNRHKKGYSSACSAFQHKKCQDSKGICMCDCHE